MNTHANTENADGQNFSLQLSLLENKTFFLKIYMSKKRDEAYHWRSTM